jgi:hypothetical protein
MKSIGLQQNAKMRTRRISEIVLEFISYFADFLEKGARSRTPAGSKPLRQFRPQTSILSKSAAIMRQRLS